MDIVICGKCAWIGMWSAVGQVPPSEPDESLKKIIETNGLTCPCCPHCQSTILYRKISVYQTNVAPVSVSSPFITGVIESEPQNNELEIPNHTTFTNEHVNDNLTTTDELDSDLVADALAEEKPTEEQIAEKRNREPRLQSLSSYDCDDCGKKFQSKFKTNRCESCDNAYMNKMIGS
jgi:hypothetical protein